MTAVAVAPNANEAREQFEGEAADRARELRGQVDRMKAAAVDAKADMPAFEDRLTPEELTAVAEFLAARKRR